MRLALLILLSSAAMASCEVLPSSYGRGEEIHRKQLASKPQPPPPVARIAFPIDEYASLPMAGTASISGQAFLKTRGGEVKTGAGEVIGLYPKTSYSDQWYETAVKKGLAMEPPDQRLESYLRKVIADADGRFSFSGLPAGDFYLAAIVTWEAPTGRGWLETQGGLVARPVSVRDGESVEDFILTRINWR